MSIGALNWAASTPLTGSRRWVLMALANYANDGDGYCFPGQRAIAEWAGVSERTAREQLAWLEGDGWIERAHRMRDGWRTSDEYIVLFDRFKPEPKPRRTLRRDSPVGAADSVSATGEIRRTEPPEDPSHEPPAAIESRTESLPGLESAPRAKVIPARGQIPEHVERLAREAGDLFAGIDERARVDANARKAAARVLEQRRATVDDVLAVLRFALSDDWWSSRITSWAALERHYVTLRQRMRTSGPAEPSSAVSEPYSAARSALVGDGELTQQDRARAALARGVDPGTYWDAPDPHAWVARLSQLPVRYAGDDLVRLGLTWGYRGALTEIVADWPGLRI